ncbi:MAG: RNA polymerase subunit sigma-70 [Acidobacteria bacterium]|nr:MAG: RNA polymerase subunit sigma-70 [Acidobacteriota bacterium]REK09310.1 MAG: RNA polymerase subunit sigma-70 [Acidobacteriota bacterium]
MAPHDPTRADPTPPPTVGERDPGHPAAPYRDPDTAQARFLIEIADLRPRLLRYCSRMLGSALDGEDVVQDTLAAAFFRLDTLDGSQALAPLLYRIAHNRCIDLLRRRRFQGEATTEDRIDDGSPEHDSIASGEAARALELLVTLLPPRERSCVVLKEVLELSLEEIAEITGSSTGSVKAALHRGREKLAALQRESAATPRVRALETDPEAVALLREYVDSFNRRDWEGLAELLQEDVRLDVVGVLEDGTRQVILDRYVVNYSRLDGAWRLTLGAVDGEVVLLCMRREGGDDSDDEERVAWPIRVRLEGGRVAQLRDYVLQHPLEGARQVEIDV